MIQNSPRPKPLTTRRFDVAPTLDGYEVVDTDGRPVTNALPFDYAHLAKRRLNEAALHGPKSLAVELGCIEEEV